MKLKYDFKNEPKKFVNIEPINLVRITKSDQKLDENCKNEKKEI